MKKNRQTTQITLLIRCAIAAYLIYLAHSIIKDLGTAPNPKLMACFAVAFTFAGVLIISFAVKAFVKKEYIDYRDLQEESEVNKEESEVDNQSDKVLTDEASGDTDKSDEISQDTGKPE